MEIYRLSHANYASLSGEGGLYGSGRWHQKGALITYTASSRSLAALERLVHESIEDMPQLAMLTIWVPDDVQISRFTVKGLPEGWDSLPDSGLARDIGQQWLAANESLLMQVPSAIIQDEFNYLINPMHLEFSRIKIVDKRDYYYDPRLQKMIR
ncbi:RES family NAD+ phosphorylase [Vibrio sp. S4M6]|uniref:RES family NAD+ phosphorylase n=1 Tax=Vibrio sinus TaxID=2946865 RepID=UPI00202AACF8|nr:RES family NAD+ phosphorylase [Vibrio sinus]MCL9783288.1 RES family NAD+ phosphorylase [Vibrio sinus]